MFFIESLLDEIGRSGVFPVREHGRPAADGGGNHPKRLPVDFPAAFFSELTADVGLS
jgi:hypothetical protein